MIRITLRGVRGHLLRFLLTAIAVTLGVALVAGTYVLTDSIKKTFNDLVSQGNSAVDVSVRGKASGTTLGDGSQARAPLPLSLQKRLATVPGVAHVSPDLQGSVILVGATGTAVRNGGAPTLGLAYDRSDPTLKLVAGHGPQGPNEVAVETTTLKRARLHVGDQTKALVGSQPRQVTIAGEVSFSTSLAGATLVMIDPQTAREQFAPDGTVPSFSLRSGAGISERQLRDRVAPTLPRNAEAVTGETVSRELNDQISQALGFINTFLLVFAGISLFVGAFIIANTFSMLVAQRTRELALLRAVGASRWQVRRVVLGEAAVLGLFGSVLGIAAGVGIAAGLKAFFEAIGLDISRGLPVHARTIVVSLIVGLAVTVTSALMPAIRASRVAPVAAMRDDVATPVAGVFRRGLIGVIVLVAGVALVVPSVLADKVPWLLVAAGAILVVLGALVAAPAATRPVVRLIALPASLIGSTVGRLARENALRNPRRTAATASALMIGLALMAAVSVIAASMKASISDIVEDQITADYVLNGGGAATFPTSVSQVVSALPAVSSVANIGYMELKLGGKDLFATAASSQSISENVRLDVTSGSLRALNQTHLLISDDTADKYHWKIGQTLTAAAGTIKDTPLTIGGIYATNQALGSPVIASRDLYAKAVPAGAQGDYLLYVKAKPGTDQSALRSSLEQTVKPFVVVSVQDGKEFSNSQAGQVNQLLYVLYVLLALSVIIAVLGIINTLALSVFERTREIGLLRAVGMSRRQLRRMISIESVFTAVFGAVLGAVLGLAFGLTVQRGLVSQGLESLSIPWIPLVAVIIGSALAGMLAAILPAWRAVRLNVLQAITAD